MKAKQIQSLIMAIMLALSMALSVHAILVTEPDGTVHGADGASIGEKSHLSYEKYSKLTRTWAKDWTSTEFEDMNYPDFYGGMRLADDGGLEIAVVELNEKIKKYFADIIDLTDVSFVEVSYSYNELVREKQRISDLMLNPQTDAQRAIGGVGIGEYHVCIWMDCNSMSMAEEYVKSFTNFDCTIELGTISPVIPIEEPLECIDICCEK